MYTVYVIRSLTTGGLYTGHSEDMDRRLNEHNEGLLGRFTKNKGPWIIVYTEILLTRREAILREKYLKTGAGRDFIKRILINQGS